MTQLFAQPYDISASGFYFDSVEDYQAKAAKAVNHYGEPVEEFEMQFIDGEDIDCALAKAIGINQANIADYLELAEDWEDWQSSLLRKGFTARSPKVCNIISIMTPSPAIFRLNIPRRRLPGTLTFIVARSRGMRS